MAAIARRDVAAPTVDDCWNRIGVRGDRSCPALAEHVHCRNCPVYEAAAIQLLDRSLPDDYRRAGAKYYAQPKQNAQGARLSVVIFRLANEWLALPTSALQEVVERRVVHSLPHRQGGLVLGLVNVNGELLICVSVARLLRSGRGDSSLESGVPGLESGRLTPGPKLQTPDSRLDFPRLLVTNWDGGRLAFPVDEVWGILRFPQNELKTPPAPIADSPHHPGFTQRVFGCDGHTVGLLDTDSFFETLNRGLA
jgi:chemotaxis-related protein WspD